MTDSAKHTGPPTGFTRRSFLKGSSAVAAATALHAQQALGQEQEAAPAIIRESTTIKLVVNGKEEQVKVEPRTTLLEVLRYQLDLTGAKPVDSDGASGACTVFLDGKPALASTKLAVACQGKQVQTVESLDGEDPDPVLTAFVKHDAQQCGFCTPGFIMAVRAFLDKNPDATEEQIRAGLNSNICRCGTYANIVHAALDVVKGGGNG